MRLWHKLLLPYLPNPQLLGQHRECAAMRGNGWGRTHKTVNYVWRYPFEYLSYYHSLVIKELESRQTKNGNKYQVDQKWKSTYYRGKHRPEMPEWGRIPEDFPSIKRGYQEHDKNYLSECILNIRNKIEADTKGTYSDEDKKRFKQSTYSLVYSPG